MVCADHVLNTWRTGSKTLIRRALKSGRVCRTAASNAPSEPNILVSVNQLGGPVQDQLGLDADPGAGSEWTEPAGGPQTADTLVASSMSEVRKATTLAAMRWEDQFRHQRAPQQGGRAMFLRLLARPRTLRAGGSHMAPSQWQFVIAVCH